MDKKDKAMLGKSMRKAVSENAEDILEEVPVVGGIVSKMAKTVKQGISKYRDAKTEEAKETYPPLYMDCVTFYCKEGCLLSEGQREMLEEIVFENYEGGDEDALQIVSDFISGYAAIFPELNEYEFLSEDDGGIGESSIWFNFFDDVEFTYNADILQKVLDALNRLLGVPIFDKFDVGGHNQSRY